MNKFYKVYQGMSLPVKASFWYLVCSVFQKGISFLTVPIFTRVLTTAEYGVISVYSSWESVITIAATLYLSQGVYNNGMAKFREERDKYNVTMQTVTSVLTICLLGCYLLFRNFINRLIGLNTELMILMFLDIFFTAAVSFWSIRNRYEFKYKPVVFVTLACTILSTLSSLIMVLSVHDQRAEAKIFGQVLIRVIIYGILYFVNIKKGKILFDSRFAKYAIAFNVPLLPHYLSTTILNQSDRIMIERMIGVEEAGIYSLAYNAAMLMTIVATSLNNSFAPWMYEEMAANRFKKIGNSAIKITALIGLLCLAVVIFAPEIIAILGPEEYHSAIWIIPPTAMSVMFVFVYCCFANVEFYFEKKKLILVGSVLSASLNVILNLICIPIFGFVAAGYTTLASYIAFAVFHYASMVKICKDEGVAKPYNGIVFTVVCVIYVFLSIMCNFLYLSNIIRYSVIIVMAIVTLIIFVKYKKDIIGLLSKKRRS